MTTTGITLGLLLFQLLIMSMHPSVSGLRCHCKNSVIPVHPNLECYYDRICTIGEGQCFTKHLILEGSSKLKESGCIVEYGDQVERLCNKSSSTEVFRCCTTDKCNRAYYLDDFPYGLLSNSTESPAVDTISEPELTTITTSEPVTEPETSKIITPKSEIDEIDMKPDAVTIQAPDGPLTMDTSKSPNGVKNSYKAKN